MTSNLDLIEIKSSSIRIIAAEELFHWEFFFQELITPNNFGDKLWVLHTAPLFHFIVV